MGPADTWDPMAQWLRNLGREFELRHRVRADVAAVGHHRGENVADPIRRRVLPLGLRHEAAREPQVVVDLDEQVGEADAPHVRREPRLEPGEFGCALGSWPPWGR